MAWTNQTKNKATYTEQAKNKVVWIKTDKNLLLPNKKTVWSKQAKN